MSQMPTPQRPGFRLRLAGTEAAPHPSAQTIDQLLDGMRHADREAAAEFITRFGSKIRRRVRGKLGPAMRRIFDSQEILSTVSRRLDQYVRDGKVKATETNQLWSLIFKMANNAIVDKVRVFQRLQAVEGSDSAVAQMLLQRLLTAENGGEEKVELEIDAAIRALEDPLDRQILSFWLNGMRHIEIGAEVNLAPTAVRQRWVKIRQTLREHLERGSL